MKTHRRRRDRSGNVLVLCVVMMVMMFGFLAFAVDLGYVNVVRSELQSSADASALAAAWELIDESTLTGEANPWYREELSRDAAAEFAGYNQVAGASPSLCYEDVTIGYLANYSEPGESMTFNDPTLYNAVRVHVRKDGYQNGPASTFFARTLGINSFTSSAQATAMFVSNFGGWGPPSDGSGNLELLPFALDEDTWNDLMAGVGSDNWTWDSQLGQVVSGSDGILEVNLFPQGTGSPGNRGTVDIGSNNNSTNDIARQILEGISDDDLAYHGGELTFDENGELDLNGDTGISAGVKDELAAIMGEPRIIPIFSSVAGNGNNANYTIVMFAGIRIMEVKLTGRMSSKRVVIQPALIQTTGGIPATGETQQSYFVHSPVWLVQ